MSLGCQPTFVNRRVRRRQYGRQYTQGERYRCSKCNPAMTTKTAKRAPSQSVLCAQGTYETLLFGCGVLLRGALALAK